MLKTKEINLICKKITEQLPEYKLAIQLKELLKDKFIDLNKKLITDEENEFIRLYPESCKYQGRNRSLSLCGLDIREIENDESIEIIKYDYSRFTELEFNNQYNSDDVYLDIDKDFSVDGENIIPITILSWKRLHEYDKSLYKELTDILRKFIISTNSYRSKIKGLYELISEPKMSRLLLKTHYPELLKILKDGK